MALIDAIAKGEPAKASRMLAASPDLARKAAFVGATRQASSAFFYEQINHYVYAGDTALHVAAAAHQPEILSELIASGADPRAKNRRGAEPLHYAADGAPGSPAWSPSGQAAVIELLIKAGADPGSADKSGVLPLHRAVRTRGAKAVEALLANGADPRSRNGSGSTPLHLAVQGTGRGGSGSAEARAQQREIILSLLGHGADPADTDARGKSVMQCISSDWIRDLLQTR